MAHVGKLCTMITYVELGWPCKKVDFFLPLLIQCVWWTNFIWRSTWNSKCHVTFSNTKMNINWHLHFLLKCHHNVTCLVVHDMSICKVSIDMCGFFPPKSHYMSKSKSCVSIAMQLIFVQVFECQIAKTCKNFVKHTHCSHIILGQTNVCTKTCNFVYSYI